ncbi:MAG TPA: hypothetical protein DIW47_05385 [Bacteroidetes bacterium]|nr:hypothetical protein [Bacteroidota bacterium]
MKKFMLLLVLIASFTCFSSSAQTLAGEKFGKTLNLGVGVGYYQNYYGSHMPVLHANLELDVAKNFTLAPFISFYKYQRDYYWGNHNYPYRNYYYRETVIPIGVKGSYYFDQFLNAGSKWDFYMAGSIGFAYRSVTWEDGYDGERYATRRSPLYLDLHVGTEYHLNSKLGLFLDLSSGVSTLGLAVHF